MKLLLITIIALSSCSPIKKIHKTFKMSDPEVIKVANEVKDQEGFIHLSKDTPVWQVFSLMILTIIVACAVSKNWKNIKNKKPFSSSGPDIT